MYQNVNTTQRQPPRTGPRPQTERYRLTHDFEGTATLSETVIHAISGAANVDVSKVEEGLARQVDPTALDRIFRTGDQRATGPLGTLTLDVLGQAVTIYTDGQIVITPQPR
jgi:hypothetical protein